MVLLEGGTLIVHATALRGDSLEDIGRFGFGSCHSPSAVLEHVQKAAKARAC